MKLPSVKPWTAILVSALPALMFGVLSSKARASTAYGTLNNFDCVNDTGVECHGFEIEMDDIHSTDVTYTYDYNHYGIPKITEDNSDPVHPKVFIRYAAKRNPDGTWSAYTAIPSGPISPTDGHQFTNPSINFGGEHFGAGYYNAPTTVKYNWLIDDGTGNLVQGPPVYIATPIFVYYPPVALQPAQVQARVEQPQPQELPVLEFGVATWVKDIKTATHNANNVELGDLVDPDPDDPGAHDWTNGEPAEVETEWRILQTEFADPENPNDELEGMPEDLPNGDEVITRRYEFYKYIGPLDAETGEAVAEDVGPDGVHGIGSATYNEHFDPATGEWVEVTVDLSTVEVVGDFIGAQMSGFDVEPVLGLIDHIPDGEVNVAFASRTVVVPGANTPFYATTSGELPVGTMLEEFTGVFSGTPTVAGVFTFTVDAKDLFTNALIMSKVYTVTIAAGAPPTSTIVTMASPPEGGSTSGDGFYDNDTSVTVVATNNPGYSFFNWTEDGVEVSAAATYMFTVNTNRTLVANFILVGCSADTDCIDEDACTIDSCVDGVCFHEPIVCNDDNPCTVDNCVAGECTSLPLDCDDGDACTEDFCQSGECVNQQVSCDDGDSCTFDACVDGACISDPIVCDAIDPCTIGFCADGACVFETITCDDENACTLDSCLEGECVHDDVNCDDGDVCTVDTCSEGTCSHEPMNCDDQDPCTIDSCGVISGFFGEPVGACVHDFVNCEDGNACTLDTCNPETGACTHESQDCARLDIKPGLCPNPVDVRKPNYVVVAVVGTPEFNPAEVNTASLQFRRTDGVGSQLAPILTSISLYDIATPFYGTPCDCQALGSDGTLDLRMKFYVPNMITAFGLTSIPPGTQLSLTMTGTLMDGTAFSAVDCIRVLGTH